MSGPIVTVATDGPRRVVAAVDEAAHAIGLRPGQAVAQAQASVPGLVVLDATPEADARALEELAAWCLRYSPVVQADPPDGILMDVAGATHLLGGETALLRDVGRRLGHAGLSIRAAIADTPAAAWALARYGETRLSPPGGVAASLLPLPVAALRLPEDACRSLGLLGIERIGQLAAFPRAQLTLRFGANLVTRCDRAFGRTDDPLTPLVPAAIAQAGQAFAEPLVHAEALAEAVRRLAIRLCRDLAIRSEGARRLHAIFRRVDGRPIGLSFGTAAPSRDPAHLAGLVASRRDGVDPGFGIDAITLLAPRVETMSERQADLSGTLGSDGLPEQDPALGPLVDKLGARLGAGRVYRAAPVESHHPERCVRRVPALAPKGGASWPADLPRPSRIIDPPEPVHAVAVAPDNPPIFFVWRRVRHVVRAADGPERVRGEWWRSDEEVASLRDYYRVEDERGRCFWLFRDAPVTENGRWWLHGRFS